MRIVTSPLTAAWQRTRSGFADLGRVTAAVAWMVSIPAILSGQTLEVPRVVLDLEVQDFYEGHTGITGQPKVTLIALAPCAGGVGVGGISVGVCSRGSLEFSEDGGPWECGSGCDDLGQALAPGLNALSRYDQASKYVKGLHPNPFDYPSCGCAYHPFSYWTLEGGDGPHTFRARVWDSLHFTHREASYTVVLDTTPPTGSIEIFPYFIDDEDRHVTRCRAVTVVMHAEDQHAGWKEYRLRNSGESWGDWTDLEVRWGLLRGIKSVSWDLPAGDGDKTICAQYKDYLGHQSDEYCETITLDTASPSGTVTINDGATYTSTRSVALALTASGDPVTMRSSIDNDSTDGFTCFEPDYCGGYPDSGCLPDGLAPYSTSTSHLLTDGDGLKTAHVQLFDTAFNPVAISDQIILETEPPMAAPGSEAMTIDTGGDATATDVILRLAVVDAGSGVAEMRFSNDNEHTWSDWEPYAATKNWTLSTAGLTEQGGYRRTVIGQFRDHVGNASRFSAETLHLIDQSAPSGWVEIADEARYETSTSTTLKIRAWDRGSGVQSMRIRNGSDAWGAWQPYATAAPWTLPAGDGPKFVGIQFRDFAGHVSAESTDGIILDTTAPTGTILVAAGAASTNSRYVTVALTATDSGSGIRAVRLGIGTSSWNGWEPYLSSKSFALPSTDGPYTVCAQFSDKVDRLSSIVCDDITLAANPPHGTVAINGDAPYAVQADVTLAIARSSADADLIRVYSLGGVSTDWVPFTSSMPWQLPVNDGEKEVRVNFRRSSDPEWMYGTSFDTIVLDRTAPVACHHGVVINKSPDGPSTGDYATPRLDVEIALCAVEYASGIDSYRVRGRISGTSWSDWTSWRAFAAEVPYTLPYSSAARYGAEVQVQFRDRAGHEAVVPDPFLDDFDNIYVDVAGPTGSFIVNGESDPFVTSRTVTLNMDVEDRSGVDEMRFRNEGQEEWSPWYPYSSGLGWTLTQTEGLRVAVIGEFKDAGGHVTRLESSNRPILDTTAPTGSLTLNGGATATSSPDLLLSLDAQDQWHAVEYRERDDGTAFGSYWASLAKKETRYTLSPGEGDRTVFVQYRDVAGNISAEIPASITLDSTAPTGSVLIAGGEAVISSWEVDLSVVSGDGGSGVEAIRFRNESGVWTDWEPAQPTRGWLLSSGSGAKTVHLEIRDVAGNIGSAQGSVTVNVPPVIDRGQILVVLENSSVDTEVGTVAAGDDDSPALHFAIVGGNESGAFAIDPETGLLTVALAAVLDTESTPWFFPEIEVSDGNFTDSAVLTVLVGDVDEPPITADGEFAVAENSAAGTPVGVVVGVDPDGGAVAFSMVGGNSLGAFEIDSATGAIRVADPVPLDYETNPEFILDVEVTDGALTSPSTVIVEVTNIVEPPFIDALDPSSACEAVGDIRMVISGANFTSNSVVRWRGEELQTAVHSRSVVSAVVAGEMLSPGGGVEVTVVTEDGESEPAVFTVIGDSVGDTDGDGICNDSDPVCDGCPIVAVVAGDSDFMARMDVQSKIESTGMFARVDTIDARFSVPRVGALAPYDALLVYSSDLFYNPARLGDLLADFHDSGRGVVTAMFANHDFGGWLDLTGRWRSDGFDLLPEGSFVSGSPAALGDVLVPDHPLARGVSAFEGGWNGLEGSYRPEVTTPSGDAEVVASWTDGSPLIVVDESFRLHRRVHLGFFPVSSDHDPSGWSANTDGARIMANALSWVAVPCTDPGSPSCVLFSDDFEAGDFAQWTSVHGAVSN